MAGVCGVCGVGGVAGDGEERGRRRGDRECFYVDQPIDVINISYEVTYYRSQLYFQMVLQITNYSVHIKNSLDVMATLASLNHLNMTSRLSKISDNAFSRRHIR